MKAKLDLDTEEVKAIAHHIASELKPLIGRQGETNARAGSPLMNVKTLAAYLEVKPDWVYKKVAERGIPFLKVGRYNKFKKSEIDKWLTEQTVQPLSRNPAIRALQKHAK